MALKADRAILGGTGGKQPLGVFSQAGQHVIGAVTIDSLIDAAGLISDVGGQGRVAFVHPADFTALQKEKDLQERPLLTPDFSGGPSSTVYGLALWSTKGVAQATALVADPAQIVVAVRQDPTVAVSTDALFTADGAVCRVICRIDCGVNDPSGLVSIAATAMREGGDREGQVEQGEQVIERDLGDDMPRDPDWDDVPEALRLLAEVDDGRVTVVSEDGVGPAQLVIVPGLFGHARRLGE